jgi:asparagine synthase (glutamine-hydrolysing)
MCGIAGVVSQSLSCDEREERVRRMTARQSHRGPDDRGIVSAGAATVGMCRLAIFDPAGGRQPMATPDGRFHLVFNGAIYNFRELRTELAALGWTFRTDCDTEVLLAAAVQWGTDCLAKLRGMFAFALLDAREGSLFLARGPLGIKPLYYARLPNGTFVFASELNGVLESSLIPREIDPVAVGDYLAWFAVPAPRTIYRHVANLPPGHMVKVDAVGRCEVSTWWRLPESQVAAPKQSYTAFVGELRERLEDTIRAHRIADVPVGAFLSGGLDSSAVVGLMARTGASRLKTFSLVFNEAEFSEQEPARVAARAFGTEHHEETLTGARLAADLPRILATLDQPTGDGINTYYISQAAKGGGVTVALSGLGGDELFGGYPSFRDMPRFARFLPGWRAMPSPARKRVVDWLRRGSARRRKLADFLDHARDLHELCSLRRRVLSETNRLALLAPEARRLALRQGPNHPMLDDFVFELIGADDIQIVSAWEMRTYMADVLLRDSDVFSMAHSLELRVPFVDRVFVEWWWNQPREYRFDPRRPKAALADAVADIMPELIRTRRKQGFVLPYARWMRAELREFLRDMFSPVALARCPWLDPVTARQQWDRFDRGEDPENWPRVWTLAMLIGFANRN